MAAIPLMVAIPLDATSANKFERWSFQSSGVMPRMEIRSTVSSADWKGLSIPFAGPVGRVESLLDELQGISAKWGYSSEDFLEQRRRERELEFYRKQ